jgi:hypothetical protein
VQRRHRIFLSAVAVSTVSVLVVPTVASAATSGAFAPQLAFLGIHIPSIGEIVKGIVHLFFKVLVTALVPDFLKRAALDTLKWLIAIPNPSNPVQWPTIGRLEGNMVALGAGLLPLTFLVSATRYWILGLTGEGFSAVTALTRTAGAVAGLVVYHWLFASVVTFINVVSNSILSFHVVGDGLKRTVGLLFGGALFAGAGGVFIAVLGLVAIFLATALFLLKVATLLMFAIFFVTGPLAISLSPLPETAGLWRAWKFGLVTIGLIPVGWCVIFAVAGALASDATHLAGIGRYGPTAVVGGNLVAALAAIITFYLALRWPLVLMGHVRNLTGGLSMNPMRASAMDSSTAKLAPAQRVLMAKERLTSAVMAGGRSVGAMGGALGAPRGGLAGAGARGAAGAAGALAGVVSARGVGGALSARAGALREKAAGSALAQSGPGQALTERAARAGEVARQAPAEIKDGWRKPGGSQGATPTPGRTSQTGRSPNERVAAGAGAAGAGAAAAAAGARGRQHSDDRAASRAAAVAAHNARANPRAQPGARSASTATGASGSREGMESPARRVSSSSSRSGAPTAGGKRSRAPASSKSSSTTRSSRSQQRPVAGAPASPSTRGDHGTPERFAPKPHGHVEAVPEIAAPAPERSAPAPAPVQAPSGSGKGGGGE